MRGSQPVFVVDGHAVPISQCRSQWQSLLDACSKGTAHAACMLDKVSTMSTLGDICLLPARDSR